MQNTHVIFGTGPLGTAVMKVLKTKNSKVRMINRSGRANVPAGVEVMGADVLRGENMDAAVAGASVVYQCVNAPYDKWEEQFPVMQRTIVNAAASVGAKLVIGENVYMYGDTNGAPLTENLPYVASTKKGKVRAQMALEALRAHAEGRLSVTIGRGSDFFGPLVLGSMMGERQIGFAIRGKKASLVGNIDVPHTLTFINDMGRALVTLAEEEKANGEVWHVPNAPALTQREFMTMVFREIGSTPAISVMGKTMMWIGGLFIPAAKETVEMMYEFEKPFIVDSQKFEHMFGWRATNLPEAIRETVQWYLAHEKNVKT